MGTKVNKQRLIWTEHARRLLFEAMLFHFGPLSTWEHTSRPGRGLDQKFERFKKRFAFVIGATGPRAVETQLRFASPVKDRNKWGQSHFRVAVQCYAAALGVGFIEQANLPRVIAYKNKPRIRIMPKDQKGRRP